MQRALAKAPNEQGGEGQSEEVELDRSELPDAPLGDPLSQWRAMPANDDGRSGHAWEGLLPRLRRYLSVHARRGRLPLFAQDTLRRRDLATLGLIPPARVTLASEGERREARALCDELAGEASRDEPWIERALRYALGVRCDEALLEWWVAPLARDAQPHPCAALRRTYSLAALARMLAEGLRGSGAAEQALCDATQHPRADVRAGAATYLLAAYRLGGRAAPMRAVGALQKLAEGDGVVGVRYVARSLLAADRLPLPAEYPRGAVHFRVRPAVLSAREHSVLEVRTTHSMAHVHAALALGWSLDPGGHHMFALGGASDGAAGIVLGGPRGKPLGQVLVGDLALREGDLLRYAHAPSVEGGNSSGHTALELAVREVIEELEERVRSELPKIDGRGVFVEKGGATAKSDVRTAVLFRTQVAGTMYHDAPRVYEGLEPGAWLLLTREAENSFDDRAVEVRTKERVKLGYIPRDRNATAAALMDAGERLGARLIERDGPEHAPFLLIDVLARLW